MSKTLCVPVAEGSVLDALLSAYATHKGRTNQAQVLRELALLGLASWLELEQGQSLTSFLGREFADLLRDYYTETATSDYDPAFDQDGENDLPFWLAQREMPAHGGKRAGAGRKKKQE